MFGNLLFGQYINNNSLIHALDPRTKILAVLLLIIGFLQAQLETYIFYYAFIFLIIYWAKLNLRMVIGSLKPFLLLLSITVLLQIFFYPGEELVSIWFLKISREGIIASLNIFLKLVLIFLLTSVFTMTTSPLELTSGLEKALSPFKRYGLPVHELAMMVTIAIRFIPLLLEEAERIIRAQLSRGAPIDHGSIWQRTRSLYAILIPLFISVFRRADHLATAMEARCYRGDINRGKLTNLKLKKADFAALLVVTLIIIIL